MSLRRIDENMIDSKFTKKVSDLEVKSGELTTQLAETANNVISTKDKMNTELISKRHRKPMISFVDDDGRTALLGNWLQILKEKECKLDIAVITSFVGNNNYMTWEQLEDLKNNYPVDLVNHTHTHPSLGAITEEEVRYEYENSTEILKSRGHSHDIMIYPYGSTNDINRKVAREYCRTGVNTTGGVNTPPLNTFNLQRQSLMSNGTVMGTVESYTAHIDEAIANNGWIVFMSHSQYDSFDVEKIKAIIDYANSKDIEWVHVNEGLDNIGNIIDVGDYQSGSTGIGYSILDVDGDYHDNKNKFITSTLSNSFTMDTPISEFPHGFSYSLFYGSTHGFPTLSGVVNTYATVANASTYSYQLLMSTVDNQVFRRQGKSDGTWGEFTTLENQYLVQRGLNRYNADTPITGFPSNTVFTFTVNSAGGLGFPDNSAGTVTVYGVGSNGWSRQEFRKYRSNEVWSRFTNTDGTWAEFVKISAV